MVVVAIEPFSGYGKLEQAVERIWIIRIKALIASYRTDCKVDLQ